MMRNNVIVIWTLFAGILLLGGFVLYGAQHSCTTNAYNNRNLNSGTTDNGSVYEASVNRVETFSKSIAVLPQDFNNSFTMSSTAGEMLLVNDDTNEILYSKDSMKEVPPASTTKIMTAYVVLTHCNLNDVVTVTDDIYLENGAVALFIGKGDKVTVDELLHGLLIASANDCGVALAKYVSGSVSAFAELMNETARSFGATHSHFCNPHGLDEAGHVSCAYDLYLILKNSMGLEHFREIVSLKKYTFTYTDEKGEKVKIPITSTNQYFAGHFDEPMGITILGGKTGTTSDAGNCLALYAQNSYGDHLYGVVLNATDKSNLYSTMSALLSENN